MGVSMHFVSLKSIIALWYIVLWPYPCEITVLWSILSWRTILLCILTILAILTVILTTTDDAESHYDNKNNSKKRTKNNTYKSIWAHSNNTKTVITNADISISTTIRKAVAVLWKRITTVIGHLYFIWFRSNRNLVLNKSINN